RVILDGVFNHTGPEFFAFQDLLEKGAASRYRDWFFVHRFPVQMEPEPTYETWASVARMPKLRTSHPEVQRYFTEVGRYWIREAGIDGWRLDVANEVDLRFWQVVRQGVLEERPDAVLLGEIWHDPLPWLRGDAFHSVTFYPFWRACLDLFARRRIGVDRFDARLTRSRLSLPEPGHRALVTLFGSHDTARAGELAGDRTGRRRVGVDRCAARATRSRLSRPEPVHQALVTLLGSHDAARFGELAGDGTSHRLAVLFQMTAPGVPLVYYGDEIGLRGGEDPDNRRPMVWDRNLWDRELWETYRKAIRLRRERPALRRGRVE